MLEQCIPILAGFIRPVQIDRHHGPVLMNFIDMLTLEFQR